ncbi:hypothetical protein F4803DRAFT_546996 [Xylaria telfairii]|nr:hypothetical protein F4803DRAFT_546996 [Xylaria telfairii]
MRDMEVKKIGMLGVRSMGGAMSMLMAEGGYEVYFFDPKKECRDIHPDNKVHRTGGYNELCSKLGEAKVFVFSTPHGGPADKCVDSLKPHLKAGDVIIDCGNEHWENEHGTSPARSRSERRILHWLWCIRRLPERPRRSVYVAWR